MVWIKEHFTNLIIIHMATTKPPLNATRGSTANLATTSGRIIKLETHNPFMSQVRVNRVISIVAFIKLRVNISGDIPIQNLGIQAIFAALRRFKVKIPPIFMLCFRHCRSGKSIKIYILRNFLRDLRIDENKNPRKSNGKRKRDRKQKPILRPRRRKFDKISKLLKKTHQNRIKPIGQNSVTPHRAYFLTNLSFFAQKSLS
mmetsp:Transcript_12298/g.14033  ORF Transcript_12298/g.14033 Transcript_12298/m.14033 type:complete len:201 (-) Transcript_12298:380-982(-)